MIIPIKCMECFYEQGGVSFEHDFTELCDDGLYKIDCPKGHENYKFLTAEKFEILFDMGADALNNNFKQEAVLNFTTSLERFQEWFIRLIFTKYEIDSDKFNKTWKLVSSQSERQVGAFYFLYLKEFNEIPKEDNKMKSFRNNVVHKGYIPTYNETYEYGNYIMIYIKEVLFKLGNNYDVYIEQIKTNRFNEVLKKNANIERGKIATSEIKTIFNLGNINKDLDFRKELEQLRETQEAFERNKYKSFLK